MVVKVGKECVNIICTLRSEMILEYVEKLDSVTVVTNWLFNSHVQTLGWFTIYKLMDGAVKIVYIYTSTSTFMVSTNRLTSMVSKKVVLVCEMSSYTLGS